MDLAPRRLVKRGNDGSLIPMALRQCGDCGWQWYAMPGEAACGGGCGSTNIIEPTEGVEPEEKEPSTKTQRCHCEKCHIHFDVQYPADKADVMSVVRFILNKHHNIAPQCEGGEWDIRCLQE